MIDLKDLLIHKSKGCTLDAHPAGMWPMSPIIIATTSSAKWALNASIAIKDLRKPMHFVLSLTYLNYIFSYHICIKISSRYVLKQMHFFIKYDGRVKMDLYDKRWYSRDLHQGWLEMPCMFFVSWEHEKMLHSFEEYVEDFLLKKWKQN